MFCVKCGEILRDNALRCPVCGAFQKKKTRINTPCDCDSNKKVTFEMTRRKTHSSYNGGNSRNQNTFHFSADSSSGFHADSSRIEHIISLLRSFFAGWKDFSGRTGRREFWLTYLCIAVPTLLLYAIGGGLFGLWYLAILVPLTALGVRRLHDIGRSGWWILVKLLPVAGIILLIIWFCQDSAPATRYQAYRL